jgi:truncated hemoglobin YjbI
MSSVYEAAGGNEGLLRLAEAWHTRVMADEVVSHAFSHGFHPQHNQRLAAYWAEALGGPHTYTERYGNETAVVRIHSGNGPHDEMDQRAIACFDHALEDVGALPRSHFGRCYTTTSPGPPPRPSRLTTIQPTTFRKAWASLVGRGTAWNARSQLRPLRNLVPSTSPREGRPGRESAREPGRDRRSVVCAPA